MSLGFVCNSYGSNFMKVDVIVMRGRVRVNALLKVA